MVSSYRRPRKQSGSLTAVSDVAPAISRPQTLPLSRPGSEVGFTIGVEEEFHVIDPVTRCLVPDAGLILDHSEWDGHADAELQQSTVETRTGVCRTLDELRGQLTGLRHDMIDTAVEVGRSVIAAGTAPIFDTTEQRITATPRFQRMADNYQILAREQLICGCQTHVGIQDDELALQLMNRARPWLPALLALSASSAYWDRADTGYASYRYEQWRRWPTSGIPQRFESRAAYTTVVETLIGSGVISDIGMLYWDLRPSDNNGTLEFRIADACPTVDDVVLQAALARGIVRTCHQEVLREQPLPAISWELLTAASWQAARFGLTAALIDVQTGRPLPAADRIRQLLCYIRSALEEQGDWEEVGVLVEDVFRRGTSSQRQREVFARRGCLEDVVDRLIAETAGDPP
jgi:glutamate---cysteine ligase / carboxylate-amine ligase